MNLIMWTVFLPKTCGKMKSAGSDCVHGNPKLLSALCVWWVGRWMDLICWRREKKLREIWLGEPTMLFVRRDQDIVFLMTSLCVQTSHSYGSRPRTYSS